VALPALKEQKKIVETHNKINILESKISEFRTELAVNPVSSKEIGKLVDGMLLSIDKLSDSDRVNALIRDGESKRIEFKETVSLNRVLHERIKEGVQVPGIKSIRDKAIVKPIETEVLKTIVAFLNSNGGSLIVGVNDNGDITGLENEFDVFYKESDNQKDTFLRHLKDIQKERIGEKYYPFIELKLVTMAINNNNEHKTVLLVECRPSKSPCHLDNKDFYVRTNPATDRLEGQVMLDYYESHFKRRQGH
jgi:predicted HTH transcriptional regulator